MFYIVIKKQKTKKTEWSCVFNPPICDVWREKKIITPVLFT